MVSQLNINKQSKILDPCFGEGAFIKACIDAGYCNIYGYEIDKELYHIVNLQYPELKLINGDFLKADNKIKYDAIIMNPPYIRQERIDDLKSIGITKCEIRKDPIFSGLGNSANMYMYFVLKALEVLNIGGEMIIIFPESWLNAQIGRSFRQLMLKQAFIEKQIYVRGDVFEKNVLVDAIILKVIKGICNDEPVVERLKFCKGTFTASKNTSEHSSLVFSMPFHRYATIRRGLTTGCNAIFINPNFQQASNHCINIISSPKNICGYGTRNALFDKLLVVDEDNLTDDMQKYLSNWQKKIIQLKSPKILYDKIKKGTGWHTIKPFDSAGILFSYFVRNDMKFVMNNANVAVRDNFYIIKPIIDSYLLFSLLNNYYTYYQLECCGKKYGAGLLKIQRYDIERLSFPNISDFTQEHIRLLITHAKNMVDMGDNRIDEISNIISQYAPIKYSQIKDEYNSLKALRLGVN